MTQKLVWAWPIRGEVLKARKMHTFPRSPTEDPEVTALPIGARRVGRQAEVVASVLGEDWLDPQGTLGQNLQPGMEGGVAMETSRPAISCGVPLAFPARGC